MNSPIMICGCPGSGTSLVTKMLRHAGLFTGSDSGPMEARKYHESQAFKQYNITFLTRTIEFPHAPKSVEQFNLHNRRMQEQFDRLLESVDRDSLLNEYWGGSPALQSDKPWGWKDPRNSATALIWLSIFPDLRAVIINRIWRFRDRWKSGGSASGQWYRKQSTAKLRELYQKPFGLDEDRVIRVDVDQMTSNAECFGRVLESCGLSPEPANDLPGFLKQIGFES